MSNVDSQASAAGGIIIQVLGEMSNNAGPWRKFAQTFFLAEQPNGYFVLNDIFRYLKEDDEVEEETADVDDADLEEVQVAETKGDAIDLKSQSAVNGTAAGKKGDEHNTAPASRLQEAQANGIVKPQEPTPADASEVGMDKKVTAVAAEDTLPTRGATEAAEAAATPANQAAPTAPLSNGTTTTAAKPESAPAPPTPSAPKTWANLAASNATKWGSTVSTESRGVSSVRDNVPPPSKAAHAATTATSAAPSQGPKGHQGGPGSVFIKNVVVEQMPAQGLQAALEAKFGPMKECQVIPSKACAFAEFDSVESAKKAIQMSLPVSQGGEGGVKVGDKGWTVTVEEKRKPSDRPQAGGAPRGARGGGTPVNRGGRGGGRGGPAGRGARAS